MAQEAKEGLPWDTGEETGASLHAALPQVPRRGRGTKTTTKTMVTAAETVAMLPRRQDSAQIIGKLTTHALTMTIPPNDNEDDQQQQRDNYKKEGVM